MPKRTADYNSWRLQKLADPQIAEAYLNDALQDSPQMFLKALMNVTQAQENVAAVANKAGIKRETIYRAFSKTGNPTLDTLNSVLDALGLRIQIAARTKGTAVPSSGSTVSRAGVYKAKKRIGLRARVKSQAVEQLRFSFREELANIQQVTVPQVGHILADSMTGYGVDYVGRSGLQSALGLQISSLFINQTQKEQPSVPIDLLVAASTGTTHSAHI